MTHREYWRARDLWRRSGANQCLFPDAEIRQVLAPAGNQMGLLRTTLGSRYLQRNTRSGVWTTCLKRDLLPFNCLRLDVCGAHIPADQTLPACHLQAGIGIAVTIWVLTISAQFIRAGIRVIRICTQPQRHNHPVI